MRGIHEAITPLQTATIIDSILCKSSVKH